MAARILEIVLHGGPAADDLWGLRRGRPGDVAPSRWSQSRLDRSGDMLRAPPDDE